MRHFAALISLLAFAVLTGACGDYANSVESDITVPQSNGPNPQNLPNANTVPKPTPPPGYSITLSPVVIQEVLADGTQFVELYNATSQPADIGGWMLSDGFSSHTFGYGFTVQGNERVVIHLGVSGIDSSTDQYAPSFAPLQGNGSLALLQGGIDLVDFVQWGAASQNFEATADQLAEWTAGDFVISPAQGLSFNYNGAANNSGAWSHGNPNPGQ
ncbi:MAG: lamin tail domain-containing protein [Planctomycetes bacterium]|nr:lamin tail domain-containing protein [Planctomycetota bacterium]